jgi:hypothetical protein
VLKCSRRPESFWTTPRWQNSMRRAREAIALKVSLLPQDPA